MNRPLTIGCVLLASTSVPNCGSVVESGDASAGHSGASGAGGSSPTRIHEPRAGTCHESPLDGVPALAGAAGAGGDGGGFTSGGHGACHFIGIVE